jgi:DNA-3-methyladenine glycosylase
VILTRDFYLRPTLAVARDLLGKVLCHRTTEGLASGRIVEVEAYIGEEDPACHAAPGPTERNAPLYGPPGVAYVYLNYGLHYLVNAVTEQKGSPAAVLIRALEPVDGIELMRVRRARAKWRQGKPLPPDHELCRGPGNLTAALGITLKQNKLPLTRGPLVIEDRGYSVNDVAWSPRIGIRVGTEHHWRCYVVGSRAVSAQQDARPKGRGFMRAPADAELQP